MTSGEDSPNVVDMPTPPEYRAITQTVGSTVRAELARYGKTQDDLATCLGLTRQTVAKRLSGESAFDVVELAMVAKWLGIDAGIFNLSNEGVA